MPDTLEDGRSYAATIDYPSPTLSEQIKERKQETVPTVNAYRKYLVPAGRDIGARDLVDRSMTKSDLEKKPLTELIGVALDRKMDEVSSRLQNFMNPGDDLHLVVGGHQVDVSKGENGNVELKIDEHPSNMDLSRQLIDRHYQEFLLEIGRAERLYREKSRERQLRRQRMIELRRWRGRRYGMGMRLRRRAKGRAIMYGKRMLRARRTRAIWAIKERRLYRVRAMVQEKNERLQSASKYHYDSQKDFAQEPLESRILRARQEAERRAEREYGSGREESR